MDLAWIFYNVIIPIIALGVVIFVHELGHFLVAIKRGIVVEKFSIGFGPKIFSFKRGSTEYCVSWIPFGGYVKFLGDELETDDDAPPEKGSFYAASPMSRIYTAFSGPAVNLLFGLLLYTIVFIAGRPVLMMEYSTELGKIQKDSPAMQAGLMARDKIIAIAGKKTNKWITVLEEIALSTKDPLPITVDRNGTVITINVSPKVDPNFGIKRIGVSVWEHVVVGVIKDSPAAKAGMMDKDEIITIEGSAIYSWEDLVQAISSNKKDEISLNILRDAEIIDINVVPEIINERSMIGVVPMPEFMMVHPNPFNAFYHDIHQIFRMLHGLIFREVSPKGLAGPVGILQIMGAYARLGFINFLIILAMISINLGILNLLPIPVLDGGHILFSFIEIIKKKAIKKKTMIIFQNIFVTILIIMIVLVTYNDIIRAKKIKKLKNDSSIAKVESKANEME